MAILVFSAKLSAPTLISLYFSILRLPGGTLLFGNLRMSTYYTGTSGPALSDSCLLWISNCRFLIYSYFCASYSSAAATAVILEAVLCKLFLDPSLRDDCIFSIVPSRALTSRGVISCLNSISVLFFCTLILPMDAYFFFFLLFLLNLLTGTDNEPPFCFPVSSTFTLLLSSSIISSCMFSMLLPTDSYRALCCFLFFRAAGGSRERLMDIIMFQLI